MFVLLRKINSEGGFLDRNGTGGHLGGSSGPAVTPTTIALLSKGIAFADEDENSLSDVSSN